MWSSLLESVLVVLVYRYLVLWIFGEEIVKKQKYKFKCSICETRFSSNDKELMTYAKLMHRHNPITKKE